jgi:hypothetical protein
VGVDFVGAKFLDHALGFVEGEELGDEDGDEAGNEMLVLVGSFLLEGRRWLGIYTL